MYTVKTMRILIVIIYDSIVKQYHKDRY